MNPKEMTVIRTAHNSYATKIAYENRITYSHVNKILSYLESKKVIERKARGREQIIIFSPKLIVLAKLYQQIIELERELHLEKTNNVNK